MKSMIEFPRDGVVARVGVLASSLMQTGSPLNEMVELIIFYNIIVDEPRDLSTLVFVFTKRSISSLKLKNP